MRTRKRSLPGLVIGISVFIYILGVLANPAASQAAFSILYSFGGGTSFTLSGSTLYGMTSGGGAYSPAAIFRINTDGTGYQVLHNFGGGSDGDEPTSSLTLSGSTLYGMTLTGGTYDCGTIFQINTDGTGYQVLHNFGGGADGNSPPGSLTLSGSTLYGMTSLGGTYGTGTIFQINTDGTGYQILYSLSFDEGVIPYGSLTLSGSTLYGMTEGGGTDSYGTIFQINTDGTGYQVLHNFGGGSDGDWPRDSLTLSGTRLYGMTSGYPLANSDFIADFGTIFQINTDGTGYQVLHNFGGRSDGAWPFGHLTLSGSTLYGMTAGEQINGTGGGGGVWGTIFQINTDGTGYQILYSLSYDEGVFPYGSLTLSGSMLYGMTSGGGAGDTGTIFSLNIRPVNGVCESSNGNTFTSAPTTNLCSSGTATTVNGTGPWNWTCTGSNGGTSANCSANVQPTPVNGACGSASGQGFSAVPISNLCSAGSTSVVTGTGPWNWTCTGLYGGSNISCSANLDGACGSANNESFLKPPTSNFCSAGKASAITGKGPWNWTCEGSKNGITASCSASLDVNGVCGSADGKSYPTAPTTMLCHAGTPSSVTNNGQWDWTCSGSNGGATANCSAKIEINGACGSANKGDFVTEPTSNLCGAGIVSTVTGKGAWKWTCEGVNGGSKASCSANLEVNGACGSANGESLLKAPTSNLCSAGKTSRVTGKGPWNWTCEGSNGGTTENCSANLK
jgi:uncharacterized repeat protein (TIGR03803 family)